MQVTLNYFSGYTQTTTFASRMAFLVVWQGLNYVKCRFLILVDSGL